MCEHIRKHDIFLDNALYSLFYIRTVFSDYKSIKELSFSFFSLTYFSTLERVIFQTTSFVILKFSGLFRVLILHMFLTFLFIENNNLLV